MYDGRRKRLCLIICWKPKLPKYALLELTIRYLYRSKVTLNCNSTFSTRTKHVSRGVCICDPIILYPAEWRIKIRISPPQELLSERPFSNSYPKTGTATGKQKKSLYIPSDQQYVGLCKSVVRYCSIVNIYGTVASYRVVGGRQAQLDEDCTRGGGGGILRLKMFALASRLDDKHVEDLFSEID